jgi:hypothetical protein
MDAQRILVFQQNRSGESKVEGIRRYGGGRFILQILSIDDPLPAMIDDSAPYLPGEIKADLVLDFLKHPDLSMDLNLLCANRQVPVIASGKRVRMQGVFTPFT